jgi:hypothetical protein
MQGEMQQFASAPQAVGARKKYRDPAEDMGQSKNNIMHDRRVVRGNTYSSIVQPPQDTAELQTQREAQRRRLMRASQTKKRASTPEPVVGRKHMDIQTDKYLEELTERTVEFEAETQTDFLLDRPPSPLFMPAKIGVDIETQIEDGELFDFDAECEPVLEVLVGKTLEQSMMEVLEEEELESLKRHQEDFEKRRNAELLEVQRMEAAEKRRHDEMVRRVQQQKMQREQDLTMMRKVLSRSIASAHLGSLKDRVLGHLADAGAFTDSMQLAVENKFLPELLQMVSKQVEQMQRNQELVGEAMESAVSATMKLHGEKLETERRRLALVDEAERKAREEFAVEQKAIKENAARVKAERQEMLKWEEYQEAKVEETPQETHIVEVVSGDVSVAVLADGKEIPLSEEKLTELKDLFAQAAYPEGKWEQPMDKIMAVLGGTPEEPTIDTVRMAPFEEAASGDPEAPPQEAAADQPQ